MGARHIADAVRASFVGVGRVGKEVEKNLSQRESQSRRHANDFFDDLLASSLPLTKVVYGGLEEWRLREKVSKDPLVLGEHYTMLFSGPMVRVLAGVWHELLEPTQPKGKKGSPMPDALEREQIVDYFRKLDVLMELDKPFDEDSFWIKGCPTSFAVGGTAPISRAGTIRQLHRQLVGWGRHGLPPMPKGVKEKIERRPAEIARTMP